MLDVFGDLREWGKVLKQIEQLRLAGNLDDHQEGLARVLRYRYNRQLRQAALRAVPDLKKPSKDLLGVLVWIVTDEYCELETRLLACDAVRRSIDRLSDQEGTGGLQSVAFQHANEILRTSQPPVLRKAVERWYIPMRQPATHSARA